jgi:catechol 2,3-dioxygenase-like lactoylglutathione lyase family enzyme
MDYRIELLTLPVTDVDRARDFYVNQAGFQLDHDHRVNEQLRFVQLTPPGSGCSIAVGEGLLDSEPGSVKGLQMVVDDIEAAQAELSGRGLAIGDIHDLEWGRFLYFSDPDGNAWAIQQVPPRP